MWFVAKVVDEPGDGAITACRVGRCRKRAPSMDGYPVVFLTDWCGDHKLDETKIVVIGETLPQAGSSGAGPRASKAGSLGEGRLS
jgi:hypothetical protein